MQDVCSGVFNIKTCIVYIVSIKLLCLFDFVLYVQLNSCCHLWTLFPFHRTDTQPSDYWLTAQVCAFPEKAISSQTINVCKP